MRNIKAEEPRTSARGTLLRDSERMRLDALHKIGKARNSVVIAYITSIREGCFEMILNDDVRIFERHISLAKSSGAKNLDLLICTHGGDAAMPWNFHAMFRDYFPNGKLGVFVPFEAYSAGTMICLGCDEIVMSRAAVLGPVDMQVGGRPVPNSFGSLFSLISEIDPRGRLSASQKLEFLSKGSSALDTGFFYRKWKENRRVIMKALGSRRPPLSTRANQAVADYFINEVGYHAQGVRRREALEAGLSFITDLEKTPVEEDLLALFGAYADGMKLFSPLLGEYDYDAEPDDEPGEQSRPTDALVPVVIIESLFETSEAYLSYEHSRNWRSDPVRKGPATPEARGFSHAPLRWSKQSRGVNLSRQEEKQRR